jgi:putative peptide zinc metalloprotease protein
MDRFRQDLKIIRQVQRGDVSFIVKDPVALKYYRFGQLEVSLFGYLDGTRNHAEIAQLLTAQTGLSLGGSMVASFVEELKKKELIERSEKEKSLLLLERLRKQRKLKAETGSDGRDTLYMRFPFFDPDDLYNKLIKHIWFLWSREFFIFCLILFSLAATIIISNWATVGAGLANLYSFENKGLKDLLMFIVVLFTVIVFHENGHGLTCKRYGGEVHELGFMLIYFMPAFYANVTDTWTFQSKGAKLAVTFAGAFVELIICSIATFVWYFSTPGYFTHDLAFTFMMVAGLSSILINMNPLIRLDGYFALVDYLEIPKLGDDASRYLGLLVRKYIFRVPVELPEYDRRLKIILVTYGVLSFLYKVFILTVTLLFFNRHIGRLFPEMGVFIFPLLAYRLLRKKLRAIWKTIKNVYLDKKELLMKPKWLVATSLTLALALALFLFVPLPWSHQATFVVEPSEQVPVRAEAEGFIGKVLVREGDLVRRGNLLAVLRDIDLEHRRNALKSRISVVDRNMWTLRAKGDTAKAIESQQQSARLSEELRRTETQLASLSITSPIDGVVITPKVEDRMGVMLKKGAELCRIAGTGRQRARLAVDDWDLQDVKVGSSAVLRLKSDLGTDLKGKVISLAPASRLHQRLSLVATEEKRNEDANPGIELARVESGAQGTSMATANGSKLPGDKTEWAIDESQSPFEVPLTRFDVVIELERDAEGLMPGMSGDVKIYGRSKPLARIVWQGFRDWFRSKVWW